MKTLIKLLALVVPLGASAQLVIETESSWNGADGAAPFGEPDTATYGQTFMTDGLHLSLNSIDFNLDYRLGADDVEFSVFVTAWDNVTEMATGPILYQSSVQSLAVDGDWTGFSLSTGGTLLEANEQYVFFLNASNQFDGNEAEAVAGITNDAYNGGQFVFFNNGSDFNALFEDSWDIFSAYDMAFRLEFSELPPVPEPSTIGFLSMGALGVILYLRRRMRPQGVK